LALATAQPAFPRKLTDAIAGFLQTMLVKEPHPE